MFTRTKGALPARSKMRGRKRVRGAEGHGGTEISIKTQEIDDH